MLESSLLDDESHYLNVLFVCGTQGIVYTLFVGTLLGKVHISDQIVSHHKQTAQCLSDMIVFHISNNNFNSFTLEEKEIFNNW